MSHKFASIVGIVTSITNVSPLTGSTVLGYTVIYRTVQQLFK
jgi:hypothetical protein